MTTPTARALGINHVNLVVADTDVSARFYEAVFEMTLSGRHNGLTFLTTPGSNDQLALQPVEPPLALPWRPDGPTPLGVVDHFGIAVTDDAAVETLLERVRDAGGRVLTSARTSTGRLVAMIEDPDGFVVQIGG